VEIFASIPSLSMEILCRISAGLAFILNFYRFVFQDDVMMATMTVREAIMMSALLRLPAILSIAEKEKRVDDVIKLMNLEKAQHTIIGSSEMKGISGGERKRCAMSMEFITNPYILVCSLPANFSS
jgi:ABC-type multidrug transport system ATPase subunit